MSNPFDIIKDSSIWFDSQNFSAVNQSDGLTRLGIVKRALNDEKTGELRYLVEIQNHSDKIELNCTLMRRFGGVYNYEDYVLQGYTINDKPDPVTAYEAKAGDAVLVCFLNGQGREGVILGGITHAARKTIIKAEDGPQYKSEINGIETSINKDGEFTVTFKGLPTNIDQLADTPSSKIAVAEYDKDVGTSFYKFDKTGGWTVSDNASSGGKQTIKIDKENGAISLLAGNVSLKMEKESEAVSLTSKTLACTTADKVTIDTKLANITATTSAFIKSPKIAIGSDSVELLAELAELVDALGKVQPVSPVGPCTPLMATPQWPQVEAIKAKIKEITGSF